MWRLHRGQGIARRCSPWGGEERREPVGQVVERVFLSSLSFTRIKERDLQLMYRGKRKASIWTSCENNYLTNKKPLDPAIKSRDDDGGAMPVGYCALRSIFYSPSSPPPLVGEERAGPTSGGGKGGFH